MQGLKTYLTLNFNVYFHSLNVFHVRCETNQNSHYLTKYSIKNEKTPPYIISVQTYDLSSYLHSVQMIYISKVNALINLMLTTIHLIGSCTCHNGLDKYIQHHHAEYK